MSMDPFNIFSESKDKDHITTTLICLVQTPVFSKND